MVTGSNAARQSLRRRERLLLTEALRVGETIGGRPGRQPVPDRISSLRGEALTGSVTAGTATGRGRPGARTNLRPAARVGYHSSFAAGRRSLGLVLFEQRQLRGLLGLAVSSYSLARPVRWGASGSARGRLGRLALVTKEARGASEVGDDGQELHASAAARASLDVDAKGALEQLRPRSVARAVHALRRRAAGLLIAGRRWVGRSCRRWVGHDERTPLGGGGQHARVAHRNRREPPSRPTVSEHVPLPAAVARGLGNRPRIVHRVYRNDARCSEDPGEIRVWLLLAASRYTPTGFRFRRGNPWGFKSLLEH